VEALGLEGGPEALHGGVIVTASLLAHAGTDLAGVRELAEGTGGVAVGTRVTRAPRTDPGERHYRTGLLS
jgi:hypothetical protein